MFFNKCASLLLRYATKTTRRKEEERREIHLHVLLGGRVCFLLEMTHPRDLKNVRQTTTGLQNFNYYSFSSFTIEIRVNIEVATGGKNVRQNIGMAV